MKFLVVLATVLVAAGIVLAADSGKNEQSGKYFQYKIKPKNAKEVEVLLEKNEGYGDHPPIFLKPLVVGEGVNVLMEQSRVPFFESRLRLNKISFLPRGLTLIESITTRNPPAPSLTDAHATCDCDYHAGGCLISKPAPPGYICKCIYKGFWHCNSLAVPCHPNQPCPTNCTTSQCCQTTGGNCAGYANNNKNQN